MHEKLDQFTFFRNEFTQIERALFPIGSMVTVVYSTEELSMNSWISKLKDQDF